MGVGVVCGFRLAVAIAVSVVVGLSLAPAAFGEIVDINPNVSNNTNPNASTGGRVNGLASDPSNNQLFYAASEFGGLFKTVDGGFNWVRLNRHLPVVAWDVEVDPSNSQRVYATSWYDGRVNTLAGIEVSTDAGANWTRPASATPPLPYNCSATRKSEPSAFGIGIRPDAPNNVFIGTNCGLAISSNSGQNWSFVDPTPATAATNVWDVVVQAGGPTGQGIIDICGDDGHHRSTNGGSSWTPGGALWVGRCSIAASPDESNVLFVVDAQNYVYESDNGGASWTNLGPPRTFARAAFLSSSPTSAPTAEGNRFTLWYSDTKLFRVDCTTPAVHRRGVSLRVRPRRAGRDQQWGAHWDAGDLVFDTAVANDGARGSTRPMGVSTATLVTGANCQGGSQQDRLWTTVQYWRPRSLAVVDGRREPAGEHGRGLLFGTQDDGTFVSTNVAGAIRPLDRTRTAATRSTCWPTPPGRSRRHVASVRRRRQPRQTAPPRRAGL